MFIAGWCRIALVASFLVTPYTASLAPFTAAKHVYVDPSVGSDTALGTTPHTAVKTLGAAKERARTLLAAYADTDVVVSR